MPRWCVCGKHVSFGFPGGKPTHCQVCKKDGMENVKTKRCPCGKQPTFGVPNGKPTHCVVCKESGMENVVNKKCLCGKRPVFGFQMIAQHVAHGARKTGWKT